MCFPFHSFNGKYSFIKLLVCVCVVSIAVSNRRRFAFNVLLVSVANAFSSIIRVGMEISTFVLHFRRHQPIADSSTFKDLTM